MPQIELPPTPEHPDDYDAIEARLKSFFKKVIYQPLLAELKKEGIELPRKLRNARHKNPLMDALFTGRVIYSKGAFRGQFNAAISKELKKMGARFNRKTSSWELDDASLTHETQNAIKASEIHFRTKMDKIDQYLDRNLPSHLANQFHCADLFEKSIWRADRQFKKNVEKIGIRPVLSKNQQSRIAHEYQDNMRLWIQNWTEDEIKTLRKQIKTYTLRGERLETLIPPIYQVTRTIQSSHESAMKKAKFLAGQESRLLLTTYKQAKYEEAGSESYLWRCVHRPHDTSPNAHAKGNVRYTHGLLEGKEIAWNDPPVTSNPGEPVRRNHAGRDYNCRCFARPLIRIRRNPAKAP